MLCRGASHLGRVAWLQRRSAVVSTASVVQQWLSAFEPGEPLRMPALSPTMESGQIAAWLVEEGTEVGPGDALCEIQTDKATLPFETVEDGILARILAQPGDDIAVGSVIGVMVDSADDITAVQGLTIAPEDLLPEGAASEPPAETPAAPPAPTAATAPTPTASSSDEELPTGGFITPAARHMIDSLGLDGSVIPASGPGGRVLKADVLAFLGKIPAQAPMHVTSIHTGALVAQPTASGSSSAAAAAAAPTSPAGAAPGLPEREGGTFTDTVPTQMRSIIAQRLTESKATVPHFYVTMDCYIDDLLKARKAMQAAGVKVSVNDMVVKAAANALKDVPQVNAYFDTVSGEVVESEGVDVCVAVATPGGLITPIVKDANALSVPAINAKVGDLAVRAREGRLAPNEFQGGSFTISNLGMFGIDEFVAVINPPQSAILAVGGGQRVLVFPDGDDTQEPVAVTRMTVQLSGDRRVIDEAVAAQFLQVFREYIHMPLMM